MNICIYECLSFSLRQLKDFVTSRLFILTSNMASLMWGAELSAPLDTQEKLGLVPGLKNRYLSCFKFTTIRFHQKFSRNKELGEKIQEKDFFINKRVDVSLRK